MTISSSNRRAGPFLGNGVTVLFPFEFKVFKKEDVTVTFTDEFGIESELVLDSDYSVTLNLNQDANPGGTIRYPRVGSPRPVMAEGQRLTLTGGLPETQPTDLPNLSPFFPQVVENAIDRTVVLIQQLSEALNRAFKVAVSDTNPAGVLPTAEVRADKLLGFDSNGDITVYANGPGSSVQLQNDLANTSDRSKGDALIGVRQPYVGAVPRTQHEKNAETISVKDFGAVGDGVADDTGPIQAALDAAAGKTLLINAGIYLLKTGSPKVSSNTTVVGDGIGATVLVQPNYYKYDRPAAPYVKEDVVDWNALWMDVGTVNVDISGLECRGPFYQESEAAYASNPVQSWPANNGIHVRGRDFQWRKNLAPQGVSQNIRIHGVKVEGFAEDAIQLDNVDDAFVWGNILTRCGRGGARCYGGLRNWVLANAISHLYPGDYLNNGNRMYGVTFTRVYQSPLESYRPSQWCTASDNKVSAVPYWKGLDTHGGQHISFINNQIDECHSGIGIDKGGFDDSDGVAPPYDIIIRGNTIRRTLPDDPNEGDLGQVGPAMTIFAHDQTDENIGRRIVVADNVVYGHGENGRGGAIWYSNWIGVQHHHNSIVRSRRAAICIRERFEGSVDGDIIDNIVPSTLGVQDAIAIETANARGRIGDGIFINRETTAMRAIVLANPAASQGFSVSDGHRFIDIAGGGITKVQNPNNDQFGPWTRKLRAAARIDSDGTVLGGRGVSSVQKTGTGTYLITLEEPCTSTSSMWPIASSRGGSARIVQADATTQNTATVLTKDSTGTPIDASFVVHVFGY